MNYSDLQKLKAFFSALKDSGFKPDLKQIPSFTIIDGQRTPVDKTYCLQLLRQLPALQGDKFKDDNTIIQYLSDPIKRKALLGEFSKEQQLELTEALEEKPAPAEATGEPLETSAEQGSSTQTPASSPAATGVGIPGLPSAPSISFGRRRVVYNVPHAPETPKPEIHIANKSGVVREAGDPSKLVTANKSGVVSETPPPKIFIANKSGSVVGERTITPSQNLGGRGFKMPYSFRNAAANFSSGAQRFIGPNLGRIGRGLGGIVKGVGRGIGGPGLNGAYNLLGKGGGWAINVVPRISTNATGIGRIASPANAKKWVLLGMLIFFGIFSLAFTSAPDQIDTGDQSSAITTTPFMVGVNFFSLTGKDTDTLGRILQYLKSSCGVSLVRLFYTSEPTEDLKKTLDLGSKYNIKFIVSLADFANRTSTSSLIPLSSGSVSSGPAENPTSWYESGYQGAYKTHVEKIVTTFKNHPAIYAWELANEPHCAGFAECTSAYTTWVKNMSELIKSIDSTHLISIGTQANAEFQFGDSVLDGQYEKINSFSSIGALTGHYYDGSTDAILHAADTFQSQKDLMIKEVAIAKKLNKPFYIGEAGFLCQENQPLCTNVSDDEKTRRATKLKSELDEFYKAGARGYLIWQYSDKITDPSNIPDNDAFSFFEGDPICAVLKEYSQKAVGNTPTNQNAFCPAVGKISTPYGYNIFDYPDVGNEGCGTLTKCHSGIDIAATLGSPIKSPISGTIRTLDFAEYKGNYVEIVDSTGLVVTLEHLQDFKTVLNAQVSVGDIIGTVGQTGKGVTGPVLHYRLNKNGSLLNPFKTLGSSATLDPKALTISDEISQNNYNNSQPSDPSGYWGECR